MAQREGRGGRGACMCAGGGHAKGNKEQHHQQKHTDSTWPVSWRVVRAPPSENVFNTQTKERKSTRRRVNESKEWMDGWIEESKQPGSFTCFCCAPAAGQQEKEGVERPTNYTLLLRSVSDSHSFCFFRPPLLDARFVHWFSIHGMAQNGWIYPFLPPAHPPLTQTAAAALISTYFPPTPHLFTFCSLPPTHLFSGYVYIFLLSSSFD